MLGLNPHVLLSPFEIINFEREAPHFHFAPGVRQEPMMLFDCSLSVSDPSWFP